MPRRTLSPRISTMVTTMLSPMMILSSRCRDRTSIDGSFLAASVRRLDVGHECSYRQEDPPRVRRLVGGETVRRGLKLCGPAQGWRVGRADGRLGLGVSDAVRRGKSGTNQATRLRLVVEVVRAGEIRVGWLKVGCTSMCCVVVS